MRRLLPLLFALVLVGLVMWSIGRDPGTGTAPVAPGPDEDRGMDVAAPPPAVGPAGDSEPEPPSAPPEPTKKWVPDPNGLPIAGRVVDASGEPIEGVTISIWRRAADGLISPPSLETAADGSFRIDGLPEGRYRLWAVAPLFLREYLRDVPAGRTDLNLTLQSAGRILVRLLPPEGEEMPDRPRVQYHAERWLEREARFQHCAVDHASTPEFTVDGLRAGRYRVGARTLGVGLGVRNDVVVEAGRTTEIDLPLAAGAVIEGRVLSETSGMPIAGALVVVGRAGRGLSPLYLMNEDMAFWNEAAPTRTDRDGDFRIPGLTAGKYDLAARAKGHRPVLEPGVSAPTGEAPLVLRLAAGGAVEVLVLDRSGKPVGDADVSVDIERGSFEAVTDVEGRCVIDGLPPGTVDLGAFTDPWSRIVTVTIVAGQTVTATVRAPRGEAVLSGVLTRGGRPLPDRRIAAQFEDGGEIDVSAQSGPDGKYRLEGLPVGPVDLVLRDSHGQPRPIGTHHLRPGENTFDYDLPAGSLLLRVVDEKSRAPVPHAGVYSGAQWLGNAGQDGVVRIPELEELPLEILVTSFRHAPRAVKVRPTPKPTEVLVALQSSVKLTVTVVDGDGRPVLLSEIGIRDAEGRELQAAALRGDGNVDTKGITRFALAPGPYDVAVVAEGYGKAERRVELPEAGTAVRVVLERE